MAMFLFLHVIFATIFALGLGWINGTMSSHVASVSLILGSLVAYFFSRGLSFTRKKNNTNLDRLFFAMVIGIVIYQAAFLFYFKEQSWWTLNPHNFGDLPWHISIIKYIAGGSVIWPKNPIFATDLIRYPFGIDLYNALWESLGVSLLQHLSTTLIVVLGVTTFWVYRWLGWIGLVGIFFSGGWFGWSYLTGEPVDIWLKGVEWKNFILALWVPQRSLLMGLPLGLLMIKNIFDEERVYKDFKGRALQVFLWGVFPFFHAHAFVITVLIVMCIALIKKRFFEQLVPLVYAAPLGTFFVYILTEGFSRASIARLSPGWMLNGSNPLSFWWWNLGPWLVVWIGLLSLSLMERYKKYWSLTFLSLFLFFIFNFIILTPWEWDNFKILVWPYILFVIILSQFIQEQVRVARRGVMLELGLAVLLSFSGVILNFNLSAAQASRIFEAKEIYELKSCLKGIPREAVFAAQPTFNHPLGFMGYKLVLGYKGHIWSHGINYQSTESRLNIIMQGQTGWNESVKQLNVTHIFWGPHEQEVFGLGDRPWMSEYERISCHSWDPIKEVSIYVVR